MVGYVRNDTANNIANGNVIDADDLDGEFNAVESAFSAATGHTHDGTAGSGGPILRIGPTQDVIAGATTLTPKTNNTLDLGSTTFRFKDAWLAGSLTAAGANLTTADINGGTLDNVTIGGSVAAPATVTTLGATAITATSGVINANSTGAALRVTQVGTGDALLIEDSANPDASPFVINAAGDVGIGTTTVTNAAGYSSLVMNGTQGGNIEFRVGGTLVNEMYSSADGTLRLGTQGANSLFLRTADTNRLEIDGSGNIAIGTTISTVAGYTSLAIGNATDGGQLRMRNGTNTIAFFSNTATSAFLGTLTTAQMRFGVQGNTQMNIDGTTGNIAVGNLITPANAVALMDLTSTTKGLLIPRMSDTQRNAIATVPTGLLIYNTTSNRLEHFNGVAWAAVGAGTVTLTDLGVNATATELNVLDGVTTDGIITRTAAGTGTARTITAGAGISVTNGNGVSGNPTIAASGITTAEIAAATLVLDSEGIGSNNNNTTIPTSAAVKAYADAIPQPIKVWVNFHGVPTSGTYSRTGTLVTVTMTAHGMSTGMIANLDFTTGTATDGSYAVTVVDANTFTVVDTVSGATSGNVTRNTYIRKGLNVSSVTRAAAGDYTINFTSALADANYTFTASAVRPSFSIASVAGAPDGGTYTTTALRVTAHPGNGSLTDSPLFTVIVVN